MSDRRGRRPTGGRIDNATFEAALQRVVDQLVASPADETAGARVVARLQDLPAQRWDLRPVWLAPTAAAVLLVLVVIGRSGRTPVDSTDAASQGALPVAAAPAPDADRLVIVREPAPIARGSAGRARARARMRPSPPPVDDPSTVPLLEVTGALLVGGPGDVAGVGSAPAPLPVDALALETFDHPTALEPRRDD